jgi:cytochrome c biogenesis protein CcmG/thiol:disulfide interchange protein DsbE
VLSGPEPIAGSTADPAAPAQRPARNTGLFRLLAVGLLVMVGAGLAAWAVRTVVRTSSGEVEIETAAPRTRSAVEIGAPAPAFDVPGYDGKRLRLAAFKGHPILLNFWASWCPPCRAEAPTLESTYERYRSRGVVFIGVDLQNDTWDASRNFLRGYKITYPVGRDESGTVGRTYRVVGLPTTYFIGRDGTIRSLAITGGFTGKDGVRDLVQQIENLLK